MKKILVTGANGQLGRSLQQLAGSWPQYQFVFLDRQGLDLSDKAHIQTVFSSEKADFCINAAAYTAVDKAETEAAQAYLINRDAVGEIAAQCEQNQTVLIHISSDYVYHNGQNRPLQPADECQPKGIYAKSKLAGELLAAQNCSKSLIVRTSWVYAEFGANFVKTMLRLGAEKPSLNVVSDQIGSPTYAPDLAAALMQMIAHIDQNADFDQYGIYQYSNEGVCSWYDFAHAIMQQAGLSCRVQPIFTHQYPTPAQRPSYSVLDKQPTKQVFGLEIPHWGDSLRVCLSLLKK